MRGNPGLDLAYTCERAVPSQLQFRRDQPVLWIDGVVYTQSTKRDAAGLAIVERTPPTRIARNVMLGACVADRQLASTTPAADKAGEQSVAVLRRSVMSACGQVVAHHLADRLRPLPADVTLMDAWDQRQPFGSRLTTAP